MSTSNDGKDRKAELRACVREIQTEGAKKQSDTHQKYYRVLAYLLDIQILPRSICVCCDNGNLSHLSFTQLPTVRRKTEAVAFIWKGWKQ